MGFTPFQSLWVLGWYNPSSYEGVCEYAHGMVWNETARAYNTPLNNADCELVCVPACVPRPQDIEAPHAPTPVFRAPPPPLTLQATH